MSPAPAVLWVQLPGQSLPPPLDGLAGDDRLVRVDSIEAADDALRTRDFAAVVAPPAVIQELARRRQLRLAAVEEAGRRLVEYDTDPANAVDVGERLRLLEENSATALRELMHFDHFAVRAIDARTNRLDTVLAGGFSEEAKALAIYAEAEGNGISGFVAATGQSFVCRDVSQEPRYLPGLESARSSLTVPLRLRDKIVGILNVESDQLDAFHDADREAAELYGRYVATAMHVMRLLAFERSTVTSQVAEDVRSELAAPLNDIVQFSTSLISDQAVPDASKGTLRAIIERVERSQRALRMIADSSGVRGLTGEDREIDPLLDGRRVLIADDEDIIRETIADVLAKAGALTVMAADGEQAVNLVRSRPFDLVLSDIKMPNRNGYEVFAAVKQAIPQCHVILITGFGYDPEHSIVRASREGLAGVLFKPFKVEQLFDLVHKALMPPG